MLNKQKCAVKMPKTKFTQRKLYSAVTVLIKLCHPNIVAFYGYSVRPYAFVYEYCFVDVHGTKANTLRQLLDTLNENDYFDFRERLDYSTQMVNGIEYFHSCDIIHKDIKPDNALVHGPLEKLQIKLCDFGEIAVMKQTHASIATTSYNWWSDS